MVRVLQNFCTEVHDCILINDQHRIDECNWFRFELDVSATNEQQRGAFEYKGWNLNYSWRFVENSNSLNNSSHAMSVGNGYSLRRGSGWSLDCLCGVQTHSETLVFLVPFRKVPARMNGTPQPHQQQSPTLGIEPRSLDHKPQPLTIPDSFKE